MCFSVYAETVEPEEVDPPDQSGCVNWRFDWIQKFGHCIRLRAEENKAERELTYLPVCHECKFQEKKEVA